MRLVQLLTVWKYFSAVWNDSPFVFFILVKISCHNFHVCFVRFLPPFEKEILFCCCEKLCISWRQSQSVMRGIFKSYQITKVNGTFNKVCLWLFSIVLPKWVQEKLSVLTHIWENSKHMQSLHFFFFFSSLNVFSVFLSLHVCSEVYHCSRRNYV